MKNEIVVALEESTLEGSGASRSVVEWAASRALSRGGSLRLVNVVAPDWAFPRRADYDVAVAQGDELLRSVRARLEAEYPSVDVVTTLLSGEPAEEISALSADAGMVVVGTDRGTGNDGKGTGSVSFQVAMTSTCTVAVIPAPLSPDGLSPSPDVIGVLVGVDGSPDSLLALGQAVDEAGRMGQELTVLHASGPNSPDAGAQATLAEAVAIARRMDPALVIHHVMDPGRGPAESLVSAARNAQLVVLGSKGRGGIRVLLGSVAQHLLLHANSPVIITRSASS